MSIKCQATVIRNLNVATWELASKEDPHQSDLNMIYTFLSC